ncbi:hypothetical protein LZC95_00705 [Pendulispora brunnea]|uniref:Uncharacterized protein n=1 Tax=Pendulispora brunnea TaxID=2905690 RepID=A0ABZ2KE48_9BACT
MGAMGLGFSLLLVPLSIVWPDLASSFIYDPTATNAYRAWAYVSFGIDTVLTIVLLITGIGIFKMRGWARTNALIFGAVSVVITITEQALKYAMNPGVFGGLIGIIGGTLLGLALPVVMLVVMSRAGTKARFEAANAVTPRG